MKIKIFQVDAFVTEKPFSGNPAAVCPLEEWLPEQVMQDIAAENNLAETAFYIPRGNDFAIRWFTPAVEVDLCGHATLAAAFSIFNFGSYSRDEIVFSSRSGELRVRRSEDQYTLNFPKDTYKEIPAPAALLDGLKARPLETYMGATDFMAVFATEKEVRALDPDFKTLASIGGRGVIVTAKGDTVDFVSRFFAPQAGIDEDPVTGSAHTTLTPYWAGKSGKSALQAIQLSKRQGFLQCRLLGERVELTGRGRTFLKGEIEV